MKLYEFLERVVLPTDDREAQKVVIEVTSFTLVDGVLYFVEL